MRLSQPGRDLLKRLEGSRARVYQDAAGHDTIGVGHLIKPEDRERYKDAVLSDHEIAQLLTRDLLQFEAAVTQVCQDGGLMPSQTQFDAFVLLTFNIGVGGRDPGFVTSTVLRRFLNRDEAGAAAAFLMWNKITITDRGTGERRRVVSRALEARRIAESRLFLHGYYDATPYNSLDDEEQLRALIIPSNRQGQSESVLPSESEIRPNLKSSRTMKATTAGQAGTGIAASAATVGAVREITEQAADAAHNAGDAARSVTDVTEATVRTASFMSSISFWVFAAIGIGALIAIIAFILIRRARQDDWQRGLR
ncbi:lysozyme [Algimonas porphyrae]|uniref:Lysozyme n=1 Tax=Algimonas porphyrae TaxID=1128113 RepID=A0ABQ5UYZ3_9PROT|nr:lysozyme [Algimonas porphyrae]GLQ20486.1 hypothetical protein GCM10007854_14410 [Algimonas porphyrae]